MSGLSSVPLTGADRLAGPGCRVTFSVPGKPFAKARPWATSVNGKAYVFTPKGTVTYEAHVRMAAHEALQGAPRLEGPVDADISIRLMPPKATSRVRRAAMLAGEIRPTKRPDLDNVVKSVIDGCNGVAFRDDADVVTILARKVYAEHEGVDVELREAGRRS